MAQKIEQSFKSMHELQVAVSHELRSPLTRMKVALEFIQNDKIKLSLNEEIDLLDDLTGNLLEKEGLDSGLQKLNKEELDMQALLDEILRPYGDQIIKNFATLNGGDYVIFVDRNRIFLAIRNIVENALKYHDGSEPIRVELQNKDGCSGPAGDEHTASAVVEPCEHS